MRKRGPLVLAFGGVFVALVSSTACGPRDSTETAEPLVEALVHATLRPENLDIYLFEGPAAPPIRLTDDPALDYDATFSPDGRWVVFTSERTGNSELWATEVESEREPIRLTHHEALDDAADFSPDGRRLAFVSTRDGNADIFVMPFEPGDSTAEGRATNLTHRPGGDFQPAFSPDGRSIAFSRQDVLWGNLSRENPVFDISVVNLYVMSADGSDPRQVVGRVPGPLMEPPLAYGSVAGSPTWAADGGHIYFYRIDADGRAIHRVRPDGSDDTLVAPDGLSPALMPDGRLAFSRPRTSSDLDAFDQLKTGRIVSVAPDGSDSRTESDTLNEYFAPSFDRGTGRMVVHGPGSTAGQTGELGDGFLFAPPGARSRARLPDRRLSVQGIRGFFPAITPQGEVVSTVLDRAGPPPPLSLTSLDGSSRQELFSQGDFVWGAAVARDAGSIVVAVGPPFAPGSADVDIWKLSLDGSNPVNLTADVSANDALPHVSADGRRIVFRSGGDGGVGRVYIMDADGGGRRRLTDVDAAETMPALSRDGEWVVFPTTRAGGWKLWIQRVDGSDGRFLEPQRLDIPDTSMHPRFSPDGEWVAFTSDRGGYNDEWPLTAFPQPYGDLWAVPVAGGPAVRLIHNKWEDGPGDWALVRLPER